MADETRTESRKQFLKTQAKHAKRCLFEARVVGLIVVACIVTTSTIMTLNGYIAPADRPEQPELICGIPSWVVWGLFVPWLVMIAVTWWFAIFIMKDDEPMVEQETR